MIPKRKLYFVPPGLEASPRAMGRPPQAFAGTPVPGVGLVSHARRSFHPVLWPSGASPDQAALGVIRTEPASA